MVNFVATPIGNLKDITLRALEALRGADVVFCEDTRHTLKLLNAYEIKKPLRSCHKYNEREAAESIVALAREGKEICIVSDAGMPAISDPGALVIRALQEAGVPYTVLPGACAFVCALALSAFDGAAFTFLGFLPDKKGERTRLLKEYASHKETLLLHIAPQDVDGYLKELYDAFGQRRAAAVREITKIHEECRQFLLSEGLDGEKRGEYVFVIEGNRQNPLSELSPREHVLRYMNMGYEKKEALKLAARDRGVTKSALYKETLDL